MSLPVFVKEKRHISVLLTHGTIVCWLFGRDVVADYFPERVGEPCKLFFEIFALTMFFFGIFAWSNLKERERIVVINPVVRASICRSVFHYTNYNITINLQS